MKPSRSRLYKRLEKKSKKTLLFNLIGIVLVAFLLLNFGIPLITNLTLFISGAGNTDESSVKEESVSFIPSPVLDPLPVATNSAEIKVTGEAMANHTIDLYVNNISVSQTKADDDGIFVFNLTLAEEESTIKTRSIKEDKESDFSQSFKILYKDSPPTLNIEHPADGQSFPKEQKTVEIRGKTDSGSRVTVNGFRAIIDQYDNFSYNLPLKGGENAIKIVAEDAAGNKTEKIIKVTYSP